MKAGFWSMLLVALGVGLSSGAWAKDGGRVGLNGDSKGRTFSEQLALVNKIVPISPDNFARVRDVHRNMVANMAEAMEAARLSGVEPLVPQVCFTPDTPPQTLYLFTALYQNVYGSRPKFQGDDDSRWSTTATDGGGLSQGDATTLTVSFPSDSLGSFFSGGATGFGETDSANILNTTFDTVFGSSAVWKGLLEEVFDDWGDRAGLTYVFDVTDDDAPFPSSPGAIGSRGDIRIAGHIIDGPGSGVLAYNYFPNTGDMVIDTGNAVDFFGISTNNFRGLRNTISHEHGHGLGFDHVCPLNSSIVMEPLVPLGLDHSGEDDIRHANRKYGDPNEKLNGNDSSANATPLGALDNGSSSVDNNMSIDSAGDVDFFSFTVSSSKLVTLTAAPDGTSYSEGAQNTPSLSDTSGCGTASITTTNATSIINLNVEILDTDGVTSLALGNTSGLGSAETLTEVELSAGTYFARVFSGGVSGPLEKQVQMYTLALEVADGEATLPTVSIINNGGTYVEEDAGISLESVVQNGPAISFQWSKNNADIPLATGATFEKLNVSPSDSGAYRVRIETAAKAIVTSEPVLINVVPVGGLPVGGTLGLAAVAVACAFAGSIRLRNRR